MSFARKLKRNKEIKEIENIKLTYGRKPKGKCPHCNNKTLFFTNNEQEIYCIRCDKRIK